MEARGKKRKGEVELSHPALEREIVPTTSPLPIAIRRSTLESGEGSSESVASDTGTAKALADDVVHIANALCTMSEPRGRWTDFELRVFLECCLEEMAAYNNTSNSPKPKAWENLAKKMFTKCRKKVTKGQLEYIWGSAKKRFQLWVWLESQATGQGRDPLTSAIVTDESWWESQNGVPSTFVNDPAAEGSCCYQESNNTISVLPDELAGCSKLFRLNLEGNKLVTLSDKMFLSWTMLTEMNAAHSSVHSSTTGAVSIKGQYAQSSGSKGKRKASEGDASGSSNKRSCSSGTGETLDRLATLRMASLESRARELAAAKATGPETCMEMVENDGHRPGSPVWYMAARLLRDASNGHCFMFARLTDAAGHLQYILTSENGPGSASGGSQ
uniref:Glycine-rich RNA-binding protein-like n=1 Tax=Oryza sativa subsp. japonica TaxID=39947 RepID=Q6YTZ4_ORYSJ|nr:glycine-rich RNA-binding protein-like [Oryza sativa Japonica Group]BAD17733.1 glycine-rich RNA-binding protein-like [Oryza sativa Japonica Group]